MNQIIPLNEITSITKIIYKNEIIPMTVYLEFNFVLNAIHNDYHFCITDWLEHHVIFEWLDSFKVCYRLYSLVNMCIVILKYIQAMNELSVGSFNDQTASLDVIHTTTCVSEAKVCVQVGISLIFFYTIKCNRNHLFIERFRYFITNFVVSIWVWHV